VIKQSQIEFTLLLLVGIMCLNISSVVLTGVNTSISCIVRPWLSNLSLTLFLCPLLVKTYRLHLIFNNEQLQIVTTTTTHLLLACCCFLLTGVLLLLTATLVGREGVEEVSVIGSGITLISDLVGNLSLTKLFSVLVSPMADGAYRLHQVCVVSSIRYAVYAYNGLLIIVCCVMSYITRNVERRYNESKLLMFIMCVYVSCCRYFAIVSH
jgi:hypothetical protein